MLNVLVLLWFLSIVLGVVIPQISTPNPSAGSINYKPDLKQLSYLYPVLMLFSPDEGEDYLELLRLTGLEYNDQPLGRFSETVFTKCKFPTEPRGKDSSIVLWDGGVVIYDCLEGVDVIDGGVSGYYLDVKGHTSEMEHVIFKELQRAKRNYDDRMNSAGASKDTTASGQFKLREYTKLSAFESG